MADSVLKLAVEMDAGPANSAARGFNRELEAVEKRATRTASSASSGFDQMTRNILKVVTALGLVRIAQDQFRAVLDFERARIGLEAFLGGAERARALFRDIQDFAVKSPFEFKDLAIGANRLLAANYAAEEIVHTLRGVSSAVGALGGDVGKVNDLITALTQIRTASKLTGEELRQLRNAGVEGVALEALGKAYKKTASEIQQAVRDGLVPGKDATVIIADALVQKFGKFDEAVSKTGSVAISNFMDAMHRFSDQVLARYLPAFTAFVNDTAIPALDTLSRVVNDNRGAFELLASTLANGALLFGAAKAYSSLADILRIAPALSGALMSPQGMVGALVVSGAAYQGWKLLDAVRDMPEVDDAVRKVTDRIRELRGRVDDAKQPVLDFFDELADRVRDIGVDTAPLERIAANIKFLYDQVKGLLFNTPGESVQNALALSLGATSKEVNAALQNNIKRLGVNPENARAFAADIDRLLPKTYSLNQPKGDDAAKKMAEAEKRAADIRKQAQAAELDGVRKVMLERQNVLKEFGVDSLVDKWEGGKLVSAENERAKASQHRLTILTNLELAFQAKIRDLNEKDLKEYGAYLEKKHEADEKYRIEKLLREQEVARETANIRLQTENDAINTRISAADYARDTELRRVQRESASIYGMSREQDLARTIDLEAKKAAIEQKHILDVFALRAELLDRQTRQEIADIETKFRLEGRTPEEIAARRDAILQSSAQKAIELDQATQAAITANAEDASIRQAEAVRDAYQRQFDSIKQSAGGLLDQMLSRSQSWGDAMMSIFRAAFLTPLKEAASTWIAMLLTGQRVMTGGGGLQGGRAGLGGIFGGLFGGGNGVGVLGTPSVMYGGAGTPPFLPGGSSGGRIGLSTLAGYGSGFKGILSSLGNIGYGPKGGDFGGEVAGSYRGVGGWQGGAMLAGGGILAFDGLRRGGVVGLAETTAGGALIGAKFGGGLGALIGGAIGLGAGLVRLFIKGAEDKAAEKIKAVYGIDIKDKTFLRQIVDSAKQTFGGNIDLAIRSPQIRDLIQLYAMSTGQTISGLPKTMTPVSFAQSGGQLIQQASYSNGSPIDQIAASATAGAGATQLVVRLDGQATTQLLRGEAVQAVADNPKVSQKAVMSATRANAGRREMLALQLAPGTLTS